MGGVEVVVEVGACREAGAVTAGYVLCAVAGGVECGVAQVSGGVRGGGAGK